LPPKNTPRITASACARLDQSAFARAIRFLHPGRRGHLIADQMRSWSATAFPSHAATVPASGNLIPNHRKAVTRPSGKLIPKPRTSVTKNRSNGDDIGARISRRSALPLRQRRPAIAGPDFHAPAVVFGVPPLAGQPDQPGLHRQR
jgi:hypothetical protein